MDKQAIKNSLIDKLPRGFTTTIQKRLADRNIAISKSLISKVCDADQPNWNTEIIQEAVLLAEEETCKIKSITNKAVSL